MQKVYRTSEHICKFQKKGRRPKQPSEKPVTIKNATSTERGQIRTLRDFCLNVAKNKKCFYRRYAFFLTFQQEVETGGVPPIPFDVFCVSRVFSRLARRTNWRMYPRSYAWSPQYLVHSRATHWPSFFVEPQVMMWIDILTLQQARRYPPVSMEPPAPMKVCTYTLVPIGGFVKKEACYERWRLLYTF